MFAFLTPAAVTAGNVPTPLIDQIKELRSQTREILEDKCRPMFAIGFRRPGNMPEGMRPWAVERWKELKVKAKKLDSKCLSFAYGVWDSLANCETGGNWQHYNSTYAGGLGYLHSSWSHYAPLALGAGAPSMAHLATREQQIAVAIYLRDVAGFGYTPWPACSIRLGLR